MIVCIATCELTFSLPTKKLKEGDHKLFNPQNNRPVKELIRSIRSLNTERLSDYFNTLENQADEDELNLNNVDMEKRGREWSIRSASGTRLPMVRPTRPNIKGFMTNGSENEGCEAVCDYCQAILSMRWAALCLDQCHKQGGGRAYDACYITFHLRDQIH